jgi:hypothetical protein
MRPHPHLALSGHVVVSPRFPLWGVKPTCLDLWVHALSNGYLGLAAEPRPQEV